MEKKLQIALVLYDILANHMEKIINLKVISSLSISNTQTFQAILSIVSLYMGTDKATMTLKNN